MYNLYIFNKPPVFPIGAVYTLCNIIGYGIFLSANGYLFHEQGKGTVTGAGLLGNGSN